jgi:hypothetical protein
MVAQRKESSERRERREYEKDPTDNDIRNSRTVRIFVPKVLKGREGEKDEGSRNRTGGHRDHDSQDTQVITRRRASTLCKL